MKKNFFIILLIFILPMFAYFLLSTSEASPKKTVVTSGKPQVIKFSSLMCRDCQALQKTMDKVFPQYEDKIVLTEVQVQKNDKKTIEQISKYGVTLVPTTIFISRDGKKTQRVEGDIEAKKLEKYLEDLIDE